MEQETTSKQLWLVSKDADGLYDFKNRNLHYDSKGKEIRILSVATEICGIFDTEEKARAGCPDNTCLITPLILNKKVDNRNELKIIDGSLHAKESGYE